VTAPQAKKLDSVGLSYSALVRLHSNAKDEEDFKKTLKAKGVNSKPLQLKLWQLIKSKS
jgi:hypothetical protein